MKISQKEQYDNIEKQQKEHFEKTKNDQKEWKSAIQELKNGQKEQKGQKELNLKVIENLKTEIQVKSGSITRIRNLKYVSLTIFSFLKALKVGQEEQSEKTKNHQRELNVKVLENLQSVSQVSL